MPKLNIGFVSTRFAGTDGVSLEANKWAEVFHRSGHHCFWFAGEVDQEEEISFSISEAHFKYEKNQRINQQVFGAAQRELSVTEEIHALRTTLKFQLHRFIGQYKINLLVVENALSIPLNIPLGLAITEIISETGIACIAHHHDFYWERTRFLTNAVGEYLQMAFPPKLPAIQHVVINTKARSELAHRRGIAAALIPNVLDFENPKGINGKKKEAIRHSLDLNRDDIVILQPTRVIKRKGIEIAVELVKALKDPHCKLIISHQGDDEGAEYGQWLTNYARECGVDLRIVNSYVQSPWNKNGGKSKKFSLWDLYPLADFITFPSRNEGFGNALLEAIYFNKPVLVNRYANFVRDIEPLGFDLISIDGFISNEAVQAVKTMLNSPEQQNRITAYNFRTASRYFSYSRLEKNLNYLIETLLTEKVQIEKPGFPCMTEPPDLVRLAV